MDEQDLSTSGIPMPWWVGPLTLVYAILLLLGMLLYLVRNPWLTWIPDPLGPVPLGVPWFGALGGVTIAMRGLYRHGSNWQVRYKFRYLARPISGAIVGVASYLIFVVVISATGTTPRLSGSLAYYLVAFLVGYREETFRDLVSRAVDTLLMRRAGSASIEDSVITPKQARRS